MLAHRPSESPSGVVPLVKRVVDNVEHLVSTHLELVRSELKEDASALARQIGKVLACGPIIGAGLIVALAGAALLIGAKTLIPVWGAFLIVGGGTMIIGAIALMAVLRGMRKPDVLDDSAKELSRSASVIADEAKALTGGNDVH